MKRLVSAAIVVVLAGGVGLQTLPASAQIPELPPPPEQVQPIVNAVSPISFQACLAPSTATSLVQVAAALGGVPLPLPPQTVLNPVFNVLLLDIACTYFSPKIVPASCAVDETIFGVAGVNAVNTPLPASIIATEIYAIEKALNAYGAPVGDQLSDPVWGQLGCT